jgi:hypothetical protein
VFAIVHDGRNAREFFSGGSDGRDNGTNTHLVFDGRIGLRCSQTPEVPRVPNLSFTVADDQIDWIVRRSIQDHAVQPCALQRRTPSAA